MRAVIDTAQVAGLYNVILEDGRVFHDRDAFQVRELIAKHGLVEVPRRQERAERVIAIVQGELGSGVTVTWAARNDELHLECVLGGRTHATRVGPLDDAEACARAWCAEILAAS